MKLNTRKCHLARDHVVFLGHVISENGLQPDLRNTEKVRNWPVPQSPSEIRAFVGIIDGLLRTFQNMQLRLTSWSTDCDNSLKYLKGVLSSAPIVILPDFKVPFKVYTDASKWVVGAVLVQEKEGLEYVVVYTSRALNATQKHWSTSDRELWAIVWAEREFRHYLGLSLFTIITDHCPFLVLVHCKRSLRMISRAEGLDGSWSWTQ